MPYQVRYMPWMPPLDRPWKLFNIDKSKVVGSSKTEEMAHKAIRCRTAAEHGAFYKGRRRRNKR